MKKHQASGFTLIELMIVVAIIGILAAVAIPAYTDYTTRAQVSEAVVALSSAKASVSEFFISQNTMPTTATAAGITTDIGAGVVDGIAFANADSNDIATLTIDLITTAIGNADITGTSNEFALVGTGSATGVTWDCTVSGVTNPVNTKFLPADCR